MRVAEKLDWKGLKTPGLQLEDRVVTFLFLRHGFLFVSTLCALRFQQFSSLPFPF
jgi:hypothetical protein